MTMISQQAKDGFDYIVSNAFKSALSGSSGADVQVEIIDDAQQINEKKMVMLTISSYVFRAVTMLYFTLDKPTRRYFASVGGGDAEAMSEHDLIDVICECGNIFCGAFNRELARHYPYLGMSTPNVLDRECVDYLSELDASYIKHFKISINGELTLHGSLCVCEFADIDFAVEMTEAEENNGELELF